MHVHGEIIYFGEPSGRILRTRFRSFHPLVTTMLRHIDRPSSDFTFLPFPTTLIPVFRGLIREA